MSKESGENFACPGDVQSSLRTRIANALKSADKVAKSWDEMADAVIRELNLTTLTDVETPITPIVGSYFAGKVDPL